MTTKQNKGFTLLEILLVIAAIGILAAIVLVAINPNRQLAQARNAQRRADINTIYKALEQYLIDNGSYPSSVNSNFKEICNTGTEQVGGATDCTNKADLRELVPTYLAAMPSDPSGGGYRVYISTENNKISLVAVNSEAGQSIVINSSYPWAEGGDNVYNIVEDGKTYRVHEFKTVGTSSLNVLVEGEIDYLVVAGGGGGGGRTGGGGGAGEFIEAFNAPVTGQTYLVVVGAGGAEIAASSIQGNTGSNSSFNSVTAAGGGGGGAPPGSGNGFSGGSGGGGTRSGGVGGASVKLGGGFGNAGGNGNENFNGAGGGGAGAVGGNGSGGAGGAGKASSITGTSLFYAAGGGGGVYDSAGASNSIPGLGGSSIGGNGGKGAGIASTSGANNTGSGGGGGGGDVNPGAPGRAGGSGIVIVRYLLP